jgi:hypothetical protein
VNAPATPDEPGFESGVASTPVRPADRLSGPLKVIPVELSEAQRTTEGLLAAHVAVEFGRVTGSFDARGAARYASQVADNSRLLACGSARTHLGLMRHMVGWLRSLQPGQLPNLFSSERGTS